MKKTVLLSNDLKQFNSVYSQEAIEKLKSVSNVYDTIISTENVNDHIQAIEEADYVFSTWGVPIFTNEIIDKMKNLKCFFYAASSVKHFADPYMAKGVRIVNAGKPNGDYVAKFAFSQIMLAAKGFFMQVRVGDNYNAFTTIERTKIFGSFMQKIGIIGAGNIGKEVIRMLRENNMYPMVYDPYLSEEAAKNLGAVKASLEEIFAECIVISNHAPSTAETVNMIGKKHFELMRKGATFVNTARGDAVVEEEFAEVFSRRKDIVAILDVVVTEPLPEESPINRLDNVFRTPHIAGVHGSENSVMAFSCIDELERFESGKPLQQEVTKELYAKMG